MLGADIPDLGLLVKAGRFCAGKTSRASPAAHPGLRLAGVLALLCWRPTDSAGQEMPEPLHTLARCWGRAGGTPRTDGAPPALVTSKLSQNKETSLEITCLDWLRLRAGHRGRGGCLQGVVWLLVSGDAAAAHLPRGTLPAPRG